MIHVIAIITALPDKRSEILQAFHANIPAVLAEKGCIEYRPVIDAEGAGSIQSKLGADTFTVIEKWETMEDLSAHAQSAHMAAYGKLVGGLISERKIHVLEDTN